MGNKKGKEKEKEKIKGERERKRKKKRGEEKEKKKQDKEGMHDDQPTVKVSSTKNKSNDDLWDRFFGATLPSESKISGNKTKSPLIKNKVTRRSPQVLKKFGSGEIEEKGGTITKERRKNKCSICQKEGHNRKGCPIARGTAVNVDLWN